MIHSKFNYQLETLHTVFDKEVDEKQMLEYFYEVSLNKVFPRKLRVVVDALSVIMDLTLVDLEKIAQANKQLLDQYECIWIAYIVSKPNETALSILYKDYAEAANLRFRVFSTRESALEWLNLIY